ncbi:MAG: CotH kinase family protein, partial [Bacteroidia bacterium]
MTKVKPFFLFIMLCGLWQRAHAQNTFYSQSLVQEIRIYFEEENWSNILDEYYSNELGERLQGDVIINGVTLNDVGIRYKGYSSASPGRAKNPFNIDVDYVHADQNYQGYDKIKLSNVIHDPSFIREALTYEIAQKYMPASKANFANVYVNDELIGLYTNVESVNKDFLISRFGSKYNAFIKCNPKKVDLNGENSNLSNTLGADPYAYKDLYTLKSEDSAHFENLYHFIDTLNEYPEFIEEVLDVDQALWMHAINYTLLNFDSYIGYAQNYYLYQKDDGRFQSILWDLNQSIGSFRFTDASEYWQGFSVNEAAVLDPLSHYNNFSVYPRPFLRNIFENDTYRKMFLAHIRTIVEENLANDLYKQRANYLHRIIANDVAKDPNKFYSYQAFEENIDTTVSDLIDYPGIFSLLDKRVDYLLNYYGVSGEPSIESVELLNDDITYGESLWIVANVTDAKQVDVGFRYANSGAFGSAKMYDDGQHNDGNENDGIYGVEIKNVGNVLNYYVFAQNDSAGQFSPKRAAHEYYTYTTASKSGDIILNEIMAKNDFTLTDESNDYDDWIELKNTQDYPISLEGLYLTNDENYPKKWALPNHTIPANGFAIVWADDDVNQGAMHANFKLNGAGDQLILFNSDATIADSMVFDQQSNTSSYGVYPNTYNKGIMWPTPLAENQGHDNRLKKQSLFIYPNPCDEYAQIEFLSDTTFTIQLLDQKGCVLEEFVSSGDTKYLFNTSNHKPGFYLIRAIGSTITESHKLLIQ